MTVPPPPDATLLGEDGEFLPARRPVDHPSKRSWKRDREAARLKAQGSSLYEIAEKLHLKDADGIPDPQMAALAVRNGLTVVHVSTVDEKRVEQLHSLELMKEHLWEQMNRPHVLVQQGRVIVQDGAPLEDRRFVLEIVDRLCKIEDQIARLLGTNAVTRMSIEADQIGGEIVQLISMINEVDNGAKVLSPGAGDTEGET